MFAFFLQSSNFQLIDLSCFTIFLNYTKHMHFHWVSSWPKQTNGISIYIFLPNMPTSPTSPGEWLVFPGCFTILMLQSLDSHFNKFCHMYWQVYMTMLLNTLINILETFVSCFDISTSIYWFLNDKFTQKLYILSDVFMYQSCA